MHIADKMLEPSVWVPLAGASAAVVGICAHTAKKHLADRGIPLVGVMGAFVFALQMINFPLGPLAPGVSDHVVGAGLLAIVFGPSIAVLAMSAIVVIQALLFGDGGITALGANIADMGVISVFGAYLVYRALVPWFRDAAVVVATFAGVMLGALGASAWVMLSQPYGTGFLTAMMTMHLVSGGVEAVVTLAVVRALRTAHLVDQPRLGAENA